MADNILTPYFRAGFISVFKATSSKNPDGTVGKPKYSVRALFPPTTDLSALKKEATRVLEEKWGDKLKDEKFRSKLRSPFRKNEELDNPIAGVGDDWIVMTFSANQDRRPGLVDAKLQSIIDEVEVYSGAWFRAQVRAFTYENSGNRGASFGLQNLQKIKDDEPIGKSNLPANKAFDAVETAEGSDAGSLFD